MHKLTLRPLAIFHFNFDSVEVDISKKNRSKMEPQTPASLTTLFDLKVKQQVTNNTIFSNATQVFDHKLGNFRKCTLRNPISHKNIGIEYFSGLLSNSI